VNKEPQNDPPLDLPDWSQHPPSPRMSFEEYQHWICCEVIPAAVARGEMTPEKLFEDFRRNEGSVKEWPDFSEENETNS
jgi:hypothetical protein